MKRLFSLCLLVTMTLPPCAVALEVFACEPEWGSLVREIAGDTARITVATTAAQDPHRLQAKPSLIAAMRRADLVICTGADLETGWLPLLLRRAGNPAVQQGRPGYFMAADYVRRLEVPVRVDRSQGDIHPQGNPHVHLDPGNILRVADKLAPRLGVLDPANKTTYLDKLASFRERWVAAIERWEARGSQLAGLRLASHHRSFSYLANWLELDIAATLELKPGIPPSASHLASLLEQLTPDPPAAVIRTPYANEKPSAWLSKRLGTPARQLPYTVNQDGTPRDLFELFDMTLTTLEEVQGVRR